jgi:hypothetical protein
MDFGGASHYFGERAKLAPQTFFTKRGNQTWGYERTEFGGPWRGFNPEQRAKDEREAKEAHEKRMFELNTAKEWYSMSEEGRKEIGSKLFPSLVTPEGGWTMEKLVESGVFSKSALSQPVSSFFRTNDTTNRMGVIRRTDTDFENNPIFSFIGKEAALPSTGVDSLSEIRKFSRLASEEGYFQENKELTEFITGIGRESQTQLSKMTSKAIETAKSKAVQQKVESAQTMPTSSRSSLKRGLSSSEKNNLRVGGIEDTQEEIVNIPT